LGQKELEGIFKEKPLKHFKKKLLIKLYPYSLQSFNRSLCRLMRDFKVIRLVDVVNNRNIHYLYVNKSMRKEVRGCYK